MQKQSFSNKSYLPWVIWGLAALYFFCDYFTRVSTSVMVPYLMRDFQLTALGLGTLSAFFYYPYVAMQIPVGLLIDRYSVRFLLTLMTIVTGCGCLIFGNAQQLFQAEFGRFFIGFSAAFAFVSALKLAANWFPPERLGLLAGLTQALGMLGAAVGEAPVGYSVQAFGWRHTMFLMAAVFFSLAFFILLIVRDKPQISIQKKRKPQSMKIWESLSIVMKNRLSWVNAIYAGLVFAPTATFGELWGVSFIHHVYEVSYQDAAFAVGLIFIGWAIGGPLVGWISDRMKKRKPVMLFSAVSGFILMGIILFYPLNYTVLLLLLFLFGVSNTGVAIAYVLATEINPHQVSGTALAFTNMASILFGTVLQPLIGWFLDLQAHTSVSDHFIIYTPHQFRIAMLALPICSIFALFFAYNLKESSIEYVG